MGTKVLLAVICWLTLSQASGETGSAKPASAVALDNESAESAPRFYKGLTVYASALPHPRHTIHGPTVIAASSQLSPVKTSDQGLVNLKDSYGKYVETHQSEYSPSYPQQFVPLQDLPPHLAQPLVSAAAPSFDFKAAPNYFYGPHSYKIQELQIPPHQASRFGSFSQPLVFVNDLKSFAPSNSQHNIQTPEHKLTITAQNKGNQPSYHLKVHPNSKHQFHLTYPTQPKQPLHHSSHQTYASTFQKLYEKPSSQITSFIKDSKQQGNHQPTAQIQAAPAQTSITTIVNGKKTVVQLETKPPVPLLDLNLLEPLKFDNPLVPQLQHFLPRVKGATYHKLPTYYVNQDKNKNKEFVITKTKSYDSGAVKTKTYTDPKNKKPQTQNKQSKPGITVKGYPNSGDYSYEINTPNHKETYNEQVVKYNKETNMKPVEFSYNEQTHKEPEVYTFVHSSKEPLKVTHVENDSNKDGPEHVVYNVFPKGENEDPSHKVNQPAPQESDEEPDESYESDDDNDPPPHTLQLQHHGNDDNHGTPESPEKQILNTPSKEHYHHSEHNSESPKHYIKSHSSAPPKHHHSTHHHHHHHHHSQPHHSPPHYVIKSQSSPPPREYQHQETPEFKVSYDGPVESLVYHDSPKHSHHLHAEHRGQEYQQNPHSSVDNHPGLPESHTNQAVKSFDEPINLYQPITPEYEEDIRILPTHKPHAAPIKVDPNQHLPNGPTAQTFAPYHPTKSDVREGKHTKSEHEHHALPQPFSSQQPHVQEKSRHVIIKENQEPPSEKHVHTEQVMGEMTDREENSEEDFEKAYKESAFGFPAYEAIAEDIEKDIFDPDSYGTPQYHSDYNAESSPFKQFQREDDEFPKFARLSYKDSKDNNQEDYFLDYAVHKPESYTDRIKSKVNYYKMFKKNRPEKVLYGHDDGKKEKSAKFTIAPSFDLFKPTGKSKSQNVVKYKMAAPIKYEYDYKQEAPRDSGAYASRPAFSRYKTHFVEPQLQYGFEPITSPILFVESETAASNHSPERENPGTRKKVFTEKWYMKKTRTNSKPS